jgi:hypothetical protein
LERQNHEPEADRTGNSACLVCRERPAEIRGQCRRCRQGTSRAVAAGYTTEQALLERGLILPRRNGPTLVGAFEWRRKLAELQVSGQGVLTPAAEIDSSQCQQRAARADLSTSHGS